MPKNIKKKEHKLTFYIQVVFNIPVDKEYLYAVSASEYRDLFGYRILTEINNRLLIGYVVSTYSEIPDGVLDESLLFPINEIKFIKRIIDKEPLFSRELYNLALWIKEYYISSIGESLSKIVPNAKKGKPVLLEKAKTIPDFSLTPKQQKIINRVKGYIDKGIFYSALIYGITGSGKTEVYIQLLRLVLSKGKSAIILIPEISLTPQMVNYFTARFKEEIAVIHSHLTQSEKLYYWRRIQHGKARIVIGARSAIFSPLKNLGLIVIDEEHESSYKEHASPRYLTRTIAYKRANENKAILIMGSATPSLETYYATKKGLIEIFTLTERINNTGLPEIRTVNMQGKHQILSFELVSEIKKRLTLQEQCLIFLNRRGYSYFYICTECGNIIKCKNCDISLTYHIDNTLVCHYCGFKTIPPNTCPECGGKLKKVGLAIQQLEEEMKKIFPKARIVRMDRDTVHKHNSYVDIFNRLKNHEVDILIGTQMIAQGLHFPDITLVGIVSADTSLSLPDFRSAERTFTLISQVSGRSGRGTKKGLVIIQTYQSNHYAIQYAAEQNFLKFAEEELLFRKELEYPPYKKMVRIVFRGKNREKVEEVADEFTDFLQTQKIQTKILGPAPAVIEKISGKYRWNTLLVDTNLNRIRKLILYVIGRFRKKRGVYIEIDIEPVSIL